MSTDPFIRAAVHEAGHIVAGVRRGYPVEWATIRPTPTANGQTAFIRHVDARHAAGLAILLAGTVAEFLLRGGSKPPTATLGPWSRGCVHAGPGADRGTDIATINAAGLSAKTIAAARERVGLTLVRDWGAVRVVADRLLEFGTLRRWTIERALIDTGIWRHRGAGPMPAVTPELLRPEDAKRELRRHLKSGAAAWQVAQRLPREGLYIPSVVVRAAAGSLVSGGSRARNVAARNR
ncbi:MAG: hypothetical protein ACREM1_06665 [Longimicrobiales bacterium]